MFDYVNIYSVRHCCVPLVMSHNNINFFSWGRNDTVNCYRSIVTSNYSGVFKTGHFYLPGKDGSQTRK